MEFMYISYCNLYITRDSCRSISQNNLIVQKYCLSQGCFEKAEVGIYKRKHAFDQETDQEKKNDNDQEKKKEKNTLSTKKKRKKTRT